MHVQKTWAVKAPAAIVFLVGFLALAASAGAQGWNQAYGNPANTSFVDLATRLPVRADWAFQLDGPVGYAGPAVSGDGMVWVGTEVGTLWSFQRDGSFQCSFAFKGEAITSTPAIFPNGDVAILVTRPDGDSSQTALARVSERCSLVWRIDLPRQSEKRTPSHASGSVKIWTLVDTSFLFVHSLNSIWIDATIPFPWTRSELLVYDEEGELFARHRAGYNCIEVSGGVIAEPSDKAGKATPLYETFGWPDSSPAILDSTIRGLSSPSRPLVLVTDHTCGAGLNALQFIPTADSNNRLVNHWTTEVDDHGTLLSSPTATRWGLVALGTSGHRVRVYDVPNHELRWSYDTRQPVIHPPAITPDTWIVTAEGLVHFLSPLGDLLPTARPQPFPTVGAGGLAASKTEVVVPSFEELGIWTHDLTGLTHALVDEELRTTSPALTLDGRLYVVAQTNDLAVLFGFGN